MSRGKINRGEKAKDFKGTIRRLICYLGHYRFAACSVLVLAVVSTAVWALGPRIMGMATTELVNGIVAKVQGTGSIRMDVIAKILFAAMGLYIGSALLSYIQGFFMTGITQKTCYRLRKEISEKINRMPMQYFEARTYGEVLSRITNDVDTLGNGLNQSITQLLTAVTTMIGVVVMMLTISPLMTLITLVILPISAGLIAVVMKKSQPYFRKQQEYLGVINGQVEEVYAGHTVVHAFCQEKAAQAAFSKANEQLYHVGWKSQFLSGLMQPVMVLVSNLGYVAVTVSGAFLAVQGQVTIGEIQAFIQYMRNFTDPIQQVAQVSGMLQSMAAAAERVFDFLEEKEETETGDAVLSPQQVKGNITFSHVHFGYHPDSIVMQDFNSHVKAGQRVAIVGPTGAGKTTMVKLLMRYYDVLDGKIMLDGHDIREYRRQELRSVFGMVLQDTWLFRGTIMENIRYGRLDATDEEVIRAAKAAHVHHFIMTLPGGYQMELNEEASNISQGQKQLITIARAILANRPVLILDEATSSVDTRTEKQIQMAMDNLIQGRTGFIIAHRLSTIRDADLILCVKDGDVVEQGTHNELMQKNGFYAELYNSQFEQVEEA